MDIQYVPLTRWPGEVCPAPRRGVFRASWASTMDLLRGELWQIGAQNTVLQLFLGPNEIRRDGMPRSDAKPSRPGVILSFRSRGKDLSFPCDRYCDWKDNVRAIALSLQALRAVDRYGVTRRQEQYTGWAALPNPDSPRPDGLAILVRASGMSAEDVVRNPTAAWKSAAKVLHPDRGGKASDFVAAQAAYRSLKGN